MNESVRQYKGREYVTTTEFAARVGCSRITIFNRLKKGELQGIHIDRSREIWLDWDTQRKQWQLSLSKKSTGRKLSSTAKETRKDENDGKKKRGRPKKTAEPIVHIGKPQEISPPADRLSGIPGMEEKTPRGDDLIDLSRINPEDHKDCWVMDGNAPIYNPLTGEPMLDYEKLKLKLVAQRYQLDLDEKRGQLIEKEELSRSMSAISHIMMAALNSIPQRYESVLTSMAERMSGYAFTAKDKAAIREAMKSEAITIARSISVELDKLEEQE